MGGINPQVTRKERNYCKGLAHYKLVVIQINISSASRKAEITSVTDFLNTVGAKMTATGHSPEPLTGQASGMVPMPQQRPGSQQHWAFGILPGSSCAQRPFTRPEKHVPILWSEDVKGKQKTWRDYLQLLQQLFPMLGECRRGELHWLIFLKPAPSFAF